MFFSEDSNISPMIFCSQPQVEHACEKRTVMEHNFTFHKPNIFSSNVRLNVLKRRKRLSYNKNWKLLDTMLTSMDQWSLRIRKNKTEQLCQKEEIKCTI